MLFGNSICRLQPNNTKEKKEKEPAEAGFLLIES
jgi:hypothetical protein